MYSKQPLIIMWQIDHSVANWSFCCKLISLRVCAHVQQTASDHYVANWSLCSKLIILLQTDQSPSLCTCTANRLWSLCGKLISLWQTDQSVHICMANSLCSFCAHFGFAFVYISYCPMEVFPWEIQVTFPGWGGGGDESCCPNHDSNLKNFFIQSSALTTQPCHLNLQWNLALVCVCKGGKTCLLLPQPTFHYPPTPPSCVYVCVREVRHASSCPCPPSIIPPPPSYVYMCV